MTTPLEPLPRLFLDEFDSRADGILVDAMVLAIRKSIDYGNQADVFANFRVPEEEDDGERAEAYLMTRAVEKARRVKRLLAHPEEVDGETVRDSMLDLINYGIFAVAALDLRGAGDE